MRRLLHLLTLVAAVLLACTGVVLAQNDSTTRDTPPSDEERIRPDGKESSAQDRPIPDRYIVVLKDADDADPGAVAREHSARHGARVTHVYRHALRGYAAELPEQALRGVRNDPRVQFISEDREVQADGEAPTGVRRIGASNNGEDQTLTNKGTGVDVAVLDTGIDLDHPDLDLVSDDDLLQSGKNCINSRKAPDDDNGHGSHVAGTIAARDNALTNSAVGVAPGSKLYAVKVLNRQGSGRRSQIICGIDWVTGRNTGAISGGAIEVANMSLGGAGSDKGNCGNHEDAYHLAICRSVNKDGAYGSYPGTTYVVSAGNGSEDAANHVPAAYDEVITVSALADYDGAAGGKGESPGECTTGFGGDDTFATFSNYGSDVDIAAPGVCIRSTYKSGGYARGSGTSMASPHVAGAAALYKQANPSASPSDVKAGVIAIQEPGPISGDPDATKEGVLKVSTL